MTNRSLLLIIALYLIGNTLFELGRLFWHVPLFIGSILLPPWTGAISFVAIGILTASIFKVLNGNFFAAQAEDP